MENDRNPCEASIEPFERCLALDPTDAGVHNKLAFVLWKVRSDVAGAERLFRRAIELEATKSRSASTHWQLSELLEEERGDLDGAIGEMEEFERLGGMFGVDGTQRIAKLTEKKTILQWRDWSRRRREVSVAPSDEASAQQDRERGARVSSRTHAPASARKAEREAMHSEGNTSGPRRWSWRTTRPLLQSSRPRKDLLSTVVLGVVLVSAAVYFFKKFASGPNHARRRPPATKRQVSSARTKAEVAAKKAERRAQEKATVAAKKAAAKTAATARKEAETATAKARKSSAEVTTTIVHNAEGDGDGDGDSDTDSGDQARGGGAATAVPPPIAISPKSCFASPPHAAAAVADDGGGQLRTVLEISRAEAKDEADARALPVAVSSTPTRTDPPPIATADGNAALQGILASLALGEEQLRELQTLLEAHGIADLQTAQLLTKHDWTDVGVKTGTKIKLMKLLAANTSTSVVVAAGAMIECAICFEMGAPRCLLQPCGHLCVCPSCSRGLADCPICRIHVERVQDIYHA